MTKAKTTTKRPAKKSAVSKKKSPVKKATVNKSVNKNVNKSEAIRKYLSTHKDASPKEIQAALAKKGITVTSGLVCNVKAKVNEGQQKPAEDTKASVQTAKTAADRTPVEGLMEAGNLMIQAVELVISAGAAEAKQLISTASEIVKKAQGGK